MMSVYFLDKQHLIFNVEFQTILLKVRDCLFFNSCLNNNPYNCNCKKKE